MIQITAGLTTEQWLAIREAAMWLGLAIALAVAFVMLVLCFEYHFRDDSPSATSLHDYSQELPVLREQIEVRPCEWCHGRPCLIQRWGPLASGWHCNGRKTLWRRVQS